MLDTLITNGGIAPVTDYWLLWKSNLGWIIFGLLFTGLYFWLRITNKENNTPNTWKGYFKIEKNRKDLIIHLILYFIVVFIWLLEGGKIFGDAIKDILTSLPIVNLSKQGEKASYWFTKTMPQGDFNYFIAIWGYGITEIIKKLPVVIKYLKNSYKKIFNT